MSEIIHVQLAYPSVANITRDPVAARIVSPAYAGQKSELAAILQYLYHHIKYDGEHLRDYADLMEGIAIAEMTHFDLLGKMLQNLGADPVYTETPPIRCRFFSAQCISYSVTPAKMLMDDIAAETDAIAGYERMLKQLTNEDVAAVIRRIVMDEEMHLSRLNEMLSRLGKNDKEY